IAIIFFALLAPIAFFSAGETKQPGRSYFRSRISSVLLISLILTLVALAMVSVIFVYRRNDANKQSIMSGRVGAIQNMVQNGIGSALTTADSVHRRDTRDGREEHRYRHHALRAGREADDVHLAARLGRAHRQQDGR
ncbi:MAG: hypothetical protein MJY57_01580, partial [Bacteroidales bacterium]|nr:hypothetical protein [Bacteroidales bacterium]